MPSWWLMSGDDGSSLCCHTVNFYLLTFAKYMLTIHSEWIRVATHLNCLIPKSLPVNFIKVNVIKMLNKSNIILLYVYVSYIFFLLSTKSMEKTCPKFDFMKEYKLCTESYSSAPLSSCINN